MVVAEAADLEAAVVAATVDLVVAAVAEVVTVAVAVADLEAAAVVAEMEEAVIKLTFLADLETGPVLWLTAETQTLPGEMNATNVNNPNLKVLVETQVVTAEVVEDLVVAAEEEAVEADSEVVTAEAVEEVDLEAVVVEEEAIEVVTAEVVDLVEAEAVVDQCVVAAGAVVTDIVHTRSILINLTNIMLHKLKNEKSIQEAKAPFPSISQEKSSCHAHSNQEQSCHSPFVIFLPL